MRDVQPASAWILEFARDDGTLRLSVSTSIGQTYVLEYKNPWPRALGSR